MKAWSEMNWKEQKIDYLQMLYGRLIKKYSLNEYRDDRKLFCNIYNMIVEAVNSLPDEPNNYVCVAMNKHINEDLEVLDRIKENFNLK